ncbi:hypothetical protein QAD02_017070 [Eretmocerus hayati]|uniref:Uncharacterized protein n=1 Tax=Eretmocerus hayati TaxID=131215 RepID=A0ACC2PDW8_9HYME|nr:hypothetical protein QAD02_017070 [Eretmocerus hayati]
MHLWAYTLYQRPQNFPIPDLLYQRMMSGTPNDLQVFELNRGTVSETANEPEVFQPHEWTEALVWRLLEYVQKKEGLWRLKDPLYCKVGYKDDTFKEIGKKLGNIPGEECSKKWKLLKKAYQKEVCTRKQEASSGADGPTKTRKKPRAGFYFFKGMTFLDSAKSFKSTMSNLPAPNRVKMENGRDAAEQSSQQLAPTKEVPIIRPVPKSKASIKMNDGGNSTAGQPSQLSVKVEQASPILVLNTEPIDLTSEEAICQQVQPTAIKVEKNLSGNTQDTDESAVIQNMSDGPTASIIKSEPRNLLDLPQREHYISPWMANAQMASITPQSCYSPGQSQRQSKRKDPIVESILTLTKSLNESASATPSKQNSPTDAEDSFGNFIASELRKMKSPEKNTKKQKITSVIFEKI